MTLITASDNHCLQCGACCAAYRVSFYWAEADADGVGVPMQMTGKLSPYRAFMLGTNEPNPRCIALMGIIGKKVFCSIHSRRASVCREFTPSWLNGEQQSGCDRAREQFNLPPLQPCHWWPTTPNNIPKAA
jgi:hypothetical protein